MNALTQQNWSEHITASPLPVLVIFHSEYSAYSRRSLALLKELEPEFWNARFASVDVDTEGELTLQHGIQGIPAFVLYRRGKKVAFFMGERSEKRLLKTITNAIYH